MNEKSIEKYLPLSESTYYILLASAEPLRGDAKSRSDQRLGMSGRLVPNTLYDEQGEPAEVTLPNWGDLQKVRELSGCNQLGS